MSNINLVKEEEKESIKQEKRSYILRIISLVFITFVAFSSVILFVLEIRISPSAVKQEEISVFSQISLQKEKAAKLDLLNDRLRNIDNILKNRRDYTPVLSSLLSLVPQGVFISGLSQDKETITITVSASSLLPINDFLNNILDFSSKKHKIKNITIESLTVDRTSGNYSLSIKAKTV